jgi:putative oxidoreductase
MTITHRISALEDRYPVYFLILRVALGMILAIRGIYFLTAIQPLYSVIKASRLGELNMDMTLALIVCWVHTLGGTFIILGLLTKISVWAQIPIVLGAVIFINTNSDLPHTFQDLLLSLLVLILLLVFAITGGGKISMDNYSKKHLL